jgi:hypothetical protein
LAAINEGKRRSAQRVAQMIVNILRTILLVLFAIGFYFTSVVQPSGENTSWILIFGLVVIGVVSLLSFADLLGLKFIGRLLDKFKLRIADLLYSEVK